MKKFVVSRPDTPIEDGYKVELELCQAHGRLFCVSENLEIHHAIQTGGDIYVYLDGFYASSPPTNLSPLGEDPGVFGDYYKIPNQ